MPNSFSRCELTKERRLRLAYVKFFKTASGKTFVKTFGKTIPNNNGCRHGIHQGNEDTLDFCDPADLPRASIFDHPIDHIEPMPGGGVELDGISYDDIKIATVIFENSMRWCIDGHGLVQKGLRSAVMISSMRKTLRFGLVIDKRLEKSFLRMNQSANGALDLSGRLFSPILEWLRRGDDAAEFGERIMVLFYVLRPDLIGENTLAALGRISNKTRQAKDKLANCLRDTYSGIKARVMRGDVTRTKCRISPRATPLYWG